MIALILFDRHSNLLNPLLHIQNFYVLNQDLGDKSFDNMITIPETNPLISPILSIIPLQLFAYYISKEKGLDVDKPRNLAKSVTVE